MLEDYHKVFVCGRSLGSFHAPPCETRLLVQVAAKSNGLVIITSQLISWNGRSGRRWYEKNAPVGVVLFSAA